MRFTWRVIVVLLLLPQSCAFAQIDTLRNTPPRVAHVAPGPGFATSAWRRFMIGALWREAWTTEVGVEHVDPPGSDSAHCSIRAIPQDPATLFPSEVLAGFSPKILDELVAGTYPYAAVIADVLCRAVDMDCLDSRLVMVPADSSTAGSPAVRTNRLGLLTCPLPGSTDTALCETAGVLHLAASSAHERIDAIEVLKIRLLDFVLGSCYDASDRWKWKSIEHQGIRTWKPVDSSHPLAFCKFDGVLASAAGFMGASLPSFVDGYPDIRDLAWNSRRLDRKLLSSVPKPAYDSLAAFLSRRMTDSVIRCAMERIPVERREADGPVLGGMLQQRCRELPEMARHYYDLLARTVDIYTTKEPEWIEITGCDATHLAVSVYPRGADGGKDSARCTFSRMFDSGETEEVRVYTDGTIDQVRMSGIPECGVRVRIVAESTVHDEPGPNSAASSGTGSQEPSTLEDGDLLMQKPAAFEDRGSSWETGLMLDFNSAYGPLIGIGPVYYRYGFHVAPYAWMFSAIGGYAPFGANGRIRVALVSRTLFPGALVGVNALVSGYEMSGFYGVGNEVEVLEHRDLEYYSPHLRQYRLTASLALPVSTTLQASLTGSANYVHPEGKVDRYVNEVRPYGVDGLAFFGVGGTVQYDSRDEAANPQAGALCRFSGMVYPASHGLSESFSRSQCDLRGFYGGKGMPALTLAVRALGEKSWGTVPYFEQPNLGGWAGLRGLSTGRYIGDALALGTVELRASLWRVNFLVPSTMGLAVFAEAGRVFVAGEISERWHASYGGTIWIAPWSRDNTMSVIIAGSREGMEFYLDVGMGF
jgi:hypothetical protein